MIPEIFLLLASLAFLIASIGLFRLPEGLPRLHAGTKASSFATLLGVTACLINFPTSPSAIFFSLGILHLVFLTAPLASHAIAIRITRREDFDETL